MIFIIKIIYIIGKMGLVAPGIKIIKIGYIRKDSILE